MDKANIKANMPSSRFEEINSTVSFINKNKHFTHILKFNPEPEVKPKHLWRNMKQLGISSKTIRIV